MYKSTITSLLLIFSINIIAQTIKPPLVSAIKFTDLKKDVYELSADTFRGREAGTLDELKAAAWLAERAKECGMQPAGDEGTWFQFYELQRHQIAPESAVSIGSKKYPLWQEVLVSEMTPSKVNAPIVLVNNIAELATAEVAGKVVAMQASQEGIDENMFLFIRRYPGFVRNKYYNEVLKKGAAALLFIANDLAEKSWPEVVPQLVRGQYGIAGYRDRVIPNMPVFWVHQSELNFIRNAKENFVANVSVIAYTYPSVNVVGKISGTDPKLKNEYLLLSGHHDHDGIRHVVNGDSIYNGADDNASVCAAMLAIARAYQKQPGKRSVLFVFHGAEERGLLGSRWYATHPTVEKNSITSVLNGDMIGRNNINEAALLGSTSPHKNSDDLVTAALLANEQGPKFILNQDWDKPEHPEYFYFRSDHLPYARLGIPSLFYTSMLHHDYHTPIDDAAHLDYNKLHKMTEWMYRTAWILTNQPKRPATLPNVQLER